MGYTSMNKIIRRLIFGEDIEIKMYKLKSALIELIDIIDNTPENIDSFTTQPAKQVLKELREGGG